jgi:hypothetical protein
MATAAVLKIGEGHIAAQDPKAEVELLMSKLSKSLAPMEFTI